MIHDDLRVAFEDQVLLRWAASGCRLGVVGRKALGRNLNQEMGMFIIMTLCLDIGHFLTWWWNYS